MSRIHDAIDAAIHRAAVAAKQLANPVASKVVDVHVPKHWRHSSWVQRERVRNGADYPPIWRSREWPPASSESALIVASSDPVEAEGDLFRIVGLGTDAARVEVASQVLRLPPDATALTALVWLVNAGLLDAYACLYLHLDPGAPLPQQLPSPSELCGSRVGGVGSPIALAWTRTLRHSVRQLLLRLELDAPPAVEQAIDLDGSWWRGFVLQGLRGLQLAQRDVQAVGRGVDFRTVLTALLSVLASEAGLALVGPGTGADGGSRMRARVVPFYLPQFHPTPENDVWWGPGFTEWSNVAGARPVYPGHDQPKLPSELGFVDLRIDEVVHRQVALAREHHISAFMYYFYWFSGTRLLDLPILKHSERAPGFEFCLMWANESWSRTWDGADSEVLIAQDYSAGDPEQLIDDVMPLLASPDYLRVDGRAVLAIYRPGQVPKLREVLQAWRERARAAGVELYLVCVRVPVEFDGVEDPERYGFDATMGFPPNASAWMPARGPSPTAFRHHHGNVLSYRAVADHAIGGLTSTSRLPDHPAVMVAFDNTARRQEESRIYYGANPYTFRRWLAACVEAVQVRPEGERIVFINAWNEWAEGAVLEPSATFGRSYLLAIRDVLGERSSEEGC